MLVGVVAACVATPALQGPLPVRNQHPAQLTVQHMDPASAHVLPAGSAAARLDSAYTSLFLSGTDGSNQFRMDGEYLRVAPRMRVGLGANFEFGLELPVAHTSGGWIDSFVIGYHDTLGLPDQNRQTVANDRFGVTALQNGVDVWSVDRAPLELLDVPLQLTYQILPPGEGRLGATLRGGIELPTGDSARGYGSGGIDGTVGAVLDYRALGMGWYGHAQHTFSGTPSRSRGTGFHFSDVTSIGFAAELPLATDLHAFAQFEWETSTLRELHLDAVARDQILLWLGGRLQVGSGAAIELALAEDLVWRISPDFTLWLGLVWSPGSSATPPPSYP